jgi:hypothetical protein
MTAEWNSLSLQKSRNSLHPLGMLMHRNAVSHAEQKEKRQPLKVIVILPVDPETQTTDLRLGKRLR